LLEPNTKVNLNWVDSRGMFYRPDQQEVHYLSKSRANLYLKKNNRVPKVGSITMSRKAFPGTGERLESARYLVMFEVPAPSMYGVFRKGFKKNAVKKYDISVARSFQQEGKQLAEIHLIPKEEGRDNRGVFLVDLATYGILKARHEYQGKGGNVCWYELGSTEVGGKYFLNYMDYCYTGSTHIDQIYYHHTIASMRVMASPPSEETSHYFKVCYEKVNQFTIPWNDAFWKGSSFIPWPDWVQQHLAEGEATDVYSRR
ncbi:MAG: hypothetical protein AAF399_20015, partial [Bacteroidota bacterium]